MALESIGRSRDVTLARSAAAIGSVIAAVAASSCCMLPLALFTLGAGGAWIGTLVRLAPFQPYFIAAALACLGAGYWLVYRSDRIKCERDQACQTSGAGRFVKAHSSSRPFSSRSHWASSFSFSLVVGVLASSQAAFAAEGRYQQAFARYEALLRSYIGAKQRGAERFAGAFAPKTRAGMWFRNLVIKAFAVPGLARLALGRDIADALQLPCYGWTSLDQVTAA